MKKGTFHHKYLRKSLPIYLHISKIALNKIFTVKQKKGFKPIGLWFGYKDEWPLFLKNEAEDKNIKITPKYIYSNYLFYKITFDKSKLMILNNMSQVVNFTEKYSIKSKGYTYIDWPKVAKSYSGFQVKDYHKVREQIMKKYDFSEKYLWYYMIDINSGCIWNSSAIDN